MTQLLLLGSMQSDGDRQAPRIPPLHTQKTDLSTFRATKTYSVSKPDKVERIWNKINSGWGDYNPGSLPGRGGPLA